MSSTFVVLLAQATAPGASGSGLTLQEVMASLPMDPASLFGLALLLGFFGMVLWYGTRSGKAPAAPTGAPSPVENPSGVPPTPGSSPVVGAPDLPGASSASQVSAAPVSAPGGKRPGPRGRPGR
jgi:hypothetical protein